MLKRQKRGSVSKVKALLRRAVSKRPATTQETEAAIRAKEEEEEEEIVLSDLHAALTFLRSQWACHKGLPPLILHSQLRSLMKDATELERDLDKMRRENILRMFKLNTGVDEYGFLMTEDYSRILQDTMTDSQGSSQGVSDGTSKGNSSNRDWNRQVAESFCSHVLTSHTDINILHSRLVHLLASTRLGSEFPSPDVQVSLLMQAGVLSRHTTDQTAYMFSVPGLGSIIKAILEGRKELKRILGRRQYLEMSEMELLRVKLRRSPLGVAFHLRDLLGLGLAQRVSSPSGTLIRLEKK